MLWFDNQAAEAAKFYTSIFPNSKINALVPYPEGAPGQAGQIMIASFELDGQQVTGLNGGPMFKFSEAVSFVIDCKDQEEVDYYWSKLTADGGEESQCGWLKDKFGLSWQVTPSAIPELMSKATPEQSARVMGAVMQMKKIDVATLYRAFEGK
jgi:predicted 3-demethylubiquinone-9 3-methyltransferase (glyoxalase superfamily)